MNHGVYPVVREGTYAIWASVAQLDRAPGFYPDGCRFESCRRCLYLPVWLARLGPVDWGATLTQQAECCGSLRDSVRGAPGLNDVMM